MMQLPLNQSTDILEASITEVGARLRRKELSAEQLTRHALDRAVQTQPLLNAFIDIWADSAIAQAKQLDLEAASGKWRGPLHGIPLAHKDCFERQGLPMTVGSKVTGTDLGRVTATALQRLNEAGAVDLGPLNMNEMVAGPTGQNPHFGDCRNSWDINRISGGSSSGSGAAVGAGVIYGALGSDTGGSTRLPASMNGLFGMKGTYGRVSRAGCFPRAFSLDCVGPIARSAEDCAILLQALAGWDPRDKVNGRPECPDSYCGYSPNQMGALPPKERAAFMPMTDLKAYPNAMKPAWNNNGLSQGMCGSVFLQGKQWKEWDGRLAVGYAGIGIHGTPTGNRIDILDVSKDGKSAKREELMWPTFAGRFRHLSLGPDGALYVADEASGMIYRVTPN